MNITIDERTIQDLNLDQATACLIVLKASNVPLPPELNKYLETKGLLVFDRVSKATLERLRYMYLASEGIVLTESRRKMFKELEEAYPQFDQSRPLRDGSDKVMRRYLKAINDDPEKHKEVLEAIEREKQARLVRRTKGQFVESWKNLSKYVETEGWKLYTKELPKEVSQISIGYGEQEL